MKKWMETPKGFLVYLGCAGCGKTHFCNAIMHEFNNSNIIRHRRMYSESMLSSKLKKGFDYDGTFEQAIEDLCDDDLIVLDDLGSTQIGEWKKDVLLKFLDFRYTSQKPTVITSNLTENEVRDELGFRIHSRLFAKENIILDYGNSDLRQVGY